MRYGQKPEYAARPDVANYRLPKLAEVDLLEIADYGDEHFGNGQSDRYRDSPPPLNLDHWLGEDSGFLRKSVAPLPNPLAMIFQGLFPCASLLIASSNNLARRSRNSG